VFIVHGHETAARESVAEFIRQCDLHAIVLQEPAEHGRTLMDQVETHGEAGFAIVLLTPEDLGLTPDGSGDLRPRMNVLMELGYFMGRLGRARTCALAVTSTAQLPSDLAGVVLESFDPSGGWKDALRRELRSAGYDVGG
jgi:predicted nucleotide-binding protein